MERSVLMIDAGYLFAQGGQSTYGTRSRNELSVDAAAFLEALTPLVANHSGLPLLRTYWYDGARHGIPTQDHLDIAQLPYLKLRLGRLNSRNQQKGVDALIYRDLMTLAAERSVAQAYLLSGDDDLREGVIYAQDRGVRVIIIGIRDQHGNSSQSRQLQYEADEVMTLDQTIVSRSIWCDSQENPSQFAETSRDIDELVRVVANEFASSWKDAATDSARAALLAEYPRIPVYLDAELIRACEDSLGFSLRPSSNQYLKRSARRVFWSNIREKSIDPGE